LKESFIVAIAGNSYLFISGGVFMDKQPNQKQQTDRLFNPHYLFDFLDIVLEGIKAGLYYLWIAYTRKIEKEIFQNKPKKK
jgi:hypothetical protein